MRSTAAIGTLSLLAVLALAGCTGSPAASPSEDSAASQGTTDEGSSDTSGDGGHLPSTRGAAYRDPGLPTAARVADLHARGVRFVTEPTQQPWGIMAMIARPPGDSAIPERVAE